jgi:hypothetical protein
MSRIFSALLLIPLFYFLPMLSRGQETLKDVVYLKNGSIIHGLIIEQIPNQSIKIQTEDNNIFFFKMEEIEKLTKEKSAPAINANSSKKESQGKLRNSFMGFYMGINIANLGPDGQEFCNELANLLNQVDGFSSFSCSPHSRTGFTIGYTFSQRLFGSLFLQPEISYRSQGMVIKGNGFYTSYYSSSDSKVSIEERFKLNYLELPIMIKYFFLPKGSKVKGKESFNFYLQAGPSIGLAISRKIKTVVTMSGETDDETEDYREYIKSTDISLNFGAGFELIKFLNLDFRYAIGFTNIWKEEAMETSVLKNRGFSITLGCNFPL